MTSDDRTKTTGVDSQIPKNVSPNYDVTRLGWNQRKIGITSLDMILFSTCIADKSHFESNIESRRLQVVTAPLYSLKHRFDWSQFHAHADRVGVQLMQQRLFFLELEGKSGISNNDNSSTYYLVCSNVTDQTNET
jgi:hypothetical protein